MDKQKLTPGHKVCSVNVPVPTILVEPFSEESQKLGVFVQWFGESDRADLEGMQFNFNVPTSLDSVCWMGHPELFRVVFLGQVKDWPRQDAVQAIADTATEGDIEAWIIWLTSSHYSTKQPSGVGPACFVIPMTIMLGDYFGIINPKRYCDMSVLEEERQKVVERLAALGA